MPSSPGRTRSRPAAVKSISSVRIDVGDDDDLVGRARRPRRRCRSSPARCARTTRRRARRARYIRRGRPLRIGKGTGPHSHHTSLARRRRRQPARQQLLLLVMDEQHVVGRLGLQRGRRRRSKRGPPDQQRRAAARGSASDRSSIGTTRTRVSRPMSGWSESSTHSWPRSASASSISTAANSAPPLEAVVMTETIFMAMRHGSPRRETLPIARYPAREQRRRACAAERTRRRPPRPVQRRRHPHAASCSGRRSTTPQRPGAAVERRVARQVDGVPAPLRPG